MHQCGSIGHSYTELMQSMNVISEEGKILQDKLVCKNCSQIKLILMGHYCFY